jgi:hypothetical protein
MLKKIFTFMMAFAIVIVQAEAASNNGLKAAFDEMTYNIEQQGLGDNKEFVNGELQKFSAVVRELQRQGMTNTQLIDFAKSEIKDQKVAKDLETAFNMISINKMSSEDAASYMTEALKRSYSKGASWSGQVYIYMAVGLLIVALAVGLANGGSSGSGCYDNCYYYSFQCGFDFWGPIYCDTYTCDRICS